MRLQRWVVGDEHRLGVDAEKDDLGLWCQAAQVELLEDELESLRAELGRLTSCLKKAIAQAEHFEREWYLRVGEIERLTEPPAALTAEQVAEPGWYWCPEIEEFVHIVEEEHWLTWDPILVFQRVGHVGACDVKRSCSKFIGPIMPLEIEHGREISRL